MKLSALIAEVAPRADGTHQKKMIQQMRRVAKILRVVLAREPVVTDLNRAVLEALGDAIRFYPVTNKTKRIHVAAFRRLWRLAIARHLVPRDYAAGARVGGSPIETLGDAAARGNGKPMGPGVQVLRLAGAYLAVPHFPHTKRPGRSTRAKLKKLAALLRDFLGRPPVVLDLSDSVYSKFRPWLEAQPLSKATVRVLTSLMISLRRFAQQEKILGDTMDRTDTASTRGELLGAVGSGSLWDICLSRYFPVNMRIRSEKTKHQYNVALRDFGEFVGHVAMPADLSDDNVSGMLTMLLTRGLAKQTANERRGRVNALWNWMARRRMVDAFPANYRVPEPTRIPQAWNEGQVRALFAACRDEAGQIGGVPACDWWLALHYVLWDSSERIGAILAVEWEALDWETATLLVKAEIRKGGLADMLFKLAPDTIAALRAIYRGPGLIFPWDRAPSSIYALYEHVLKRAGLPTDRKSKFHRVRKSVASHLEAAGVNSSLALGHSSPEITRKSYLDPRIVRPKPPSEILFRPLPALQVIDGTLHIEGPTAD